MKNKKLIYGMVFGVIASLIIAGCTTFIDKKSPKIACTQEAKLCPDGSYVGRVGPNCEFAPCPSSNNNIEDSDVTTNKGTIEPEDPEKSGLYNYPDYSLDTILPIPISIKYLVEHRSALNEKVVTVSGIVVGTLLGEKACPRDIGGFGVGMCAQPRIFLADTSEDNRDKNYDVMVLVSENEKDYKVGDKVEIKVTVHSSKIVVYGGKLY